MYFFLFYWYVLKVLKKLARRRLMYHSYSMQVHGYVDPSTTGDYGSFTLVHGVSPSLIKASNILTVFIEILRTRCIRLKSPREKMFLTSITYWQYHGSFSLRHWLQQSDWLPTLEAALALDEESVRRVGDDTVGGPAVSRQLRITRILMRDLLIGVC